MATSSDVVAEMVRAASEFAEAAGPKASFAFGDGERFVWHYTPVPRKGLPVAEMTSEQRALAMRLMDTTLSAQGQKTARDIMAHELVLGSLERSELGSERFPRDPGLYYFSVFGEPSFEEPWGWRAEGHHLSLHATVRDAKVSPAPSFVGANPAETPGGSRILAPLEDCGRSLLAALDARERTAALISPDAPGDILTTNRPQVTMPPLVGACDLSGTAADLLAALVRVHLQRLREPLARQAYAELNLDRVRFAWAGSDRPHEPHYYRVQGPDWLIEYDNVQNDANHIHAVWRHARHDFGRDLLGEHHVHEHTG